MPLFLSGWSPTTCDHTAPRSRSLGSNATARTRRWKNNRAENSHLPTRRRERKIAAVQEPGVTQKFLSTHAAIYNTFNVRRRLVSAKRTARFALSR